MKNIIILLIGVVFLFSILGTFNLLPEVEGLDNAPTCDTKLHDITDDTKDDLWNYTTDDLWNNDNYVLKTTIVPPKTTPCPSDTNSTASTNATQTVTESASSSSSSSSSNVNDSYTLDSTPNQTNTPATPATPEIPATPATPATNTIPVASSENSGTLSPSDYTLNAPAQPEKTDSCPPCPACERCPEPSFDCKKVPNYRSKSIGQYLPMPILTDFSKF